MIRMDIKKNLIDECNYGLKCGHPMMHPEYITIHESNSAKCSEDFAQLLKTGWFPESCHYVVDESDIWQVVPDNVSAHHCGDGTNGPGNCTSIGIEICRNESIYNDRYEKSKENAAELVRKLMDQYSIPIDHVVQHNHWDESDCPKRIRREGTWEAFLSLCHKQRRT